MAAVSSGHSAIAGLRAVSSPPADIPLPPPVPAAPVPPGIPDPEHAIAPAAPVRGLPQSVMPLPVRRPPLAPLASDTVAWELCRRAELGLEVEMATPAVGAHPASPAVMSAAAFAAAATTASVTIHATVQAVDSLPMGLHADPEAAARAALSPLLERFRSAAIAEAAAIASVDVAERELVDLARASWRVTHDEFTASKRCCRWAAEEATATVRAAIFTQSAPALDKVRTRRGLG